MRYNELEDESKGAFNKAFKFLNHLEAIEESCTAAALNSDYDGWIKLLQAWFNKLSGRLDEKDKSELQKEIINIKNIINVDLAEDIKDNLLNELQLKLERKTVELDYQMPSKKINDLGKAILG